MFFTYFFLIFNWISLITFAQVPQEKDPFNSPFNFTDLDEKNIINEFKGESIKKEQKIKKMIPLSSKSFCPLLALEKGAMNRIRALHASLKEKNNKMLRRYFMTIYNTSSHINSGRWGEYPHIEGLIDLKPELIISSREIIKTKSFLNYLDEYKVPYFQIRFTKEETFLEDLKKISEKINQEEQYQKIQEHREAVQKEIYEKIKNISTYERPKVLILMPDQRDYKGIASVFYQELFEILGAKNILQVKKPRPYIIEKRWIINSNPDFIFLVGNESEHPDFIYQDPDFSSLKAVEKKQVYVFPKGIVFWNEKGIENPLLWLWMSKLLYEDAFSDMNLSKEIEKAYWLWFETKIDMAYQQNILRYDKNQVSSKYKNLLN